jgi:hypothetical protein
MKSTLFLAYSVNRATRNDKDLRKSLDKARQENQGSEEEVTALNKKRRKKNIYQKKSEPIPKDLQELVENTKLFADAFESNDQRRALSILANKKLPFDPFRKEGSDPIERYIQHKISGPEPVKNAKVQSVLDLRGETKYPMFVSDKKLEEIAHLIQEEIECMRIPIPNRKRKLSIGTTSEND